MPMFRKKIEPRCAYCKLGSSLGENRVGCYHKGVVEDTYHCRRFEYDPLKRIPPVPAKLRREYDDEDFRLDI